MVNMRKSELRSVFARLHRHAFGASVVGMGVFLASSVAAQPAEAVSPMVETQVVGVTPTAAPVAPPLEEDAPLPPVDEPSRAARPLAIWGSLGWNSLAGFGLGLSYSFTPHITADAALGVASIGLKSGARLRYNLFAKNWTPTLGVGFQYGPGAERVVMRGDSETSAPNDPDADAEVTIEPSAFLQAMAGMSYQGKGGFNALFGVGYSVLLDEDNVRAHSGGAETVKLVRRIAGSGIVLEVTLGYAF
jgi:hypothetical protein